MNSRNVIWTPVVREKLIEFRNERFTPEETLNYISQIIIETEEFLRNPVIGKTYTEEFGRYKGDSTAKTGCLTPMGVFNSKNCLEQIAQKVLFQLKIANLDLHYYGFVFVNLNLGIISLLLAFSASLACPEPSGKTA